MKVLTREIPFFVVVGAAATLCNYLGALGAQHLGAGPLLAGFLGYLSSVGVSYVGNSRLTFRRPVIHGPQFVRFSVISLSGLGLNLTLIFVGAHLLSWPLWLALVPVTLVVPAATFAMSKYWAFREPLAEAAG